MSYDPTPADGPVPSDYFTTEEASRWLTCAQPVALKILQQLGKDCSMVCRIRNIPLHRKPVHGRRWTHENAYPAAIIREVFAANPDTAAHIPKVAG